MASVHPQDSVDVPSAARRNASYDLEFVLDAVTPVEWSQGISAPSAASQADPEFVDPPLGRLAGAVESLQSVQAQIGLSVDDYGRPRLSGEAQARVVLPCQRCLEAVEIEVRAQLGSVIWFGDEPPKESLQAGEDSDDVILSKTATMTYAALVEDDLLLALPQQVCQTDECPRLPVLAFPAPGYTAAAGNSSSVGGGESGDAQKQSGVGDSADGLADELADELADDRQRPFAGLRDLLNGQDDN